MTVRLEPPQAQPLEIIQTIVGPLLAPLATAGLVVIFVIFVLLEREDLRDRFIKLAGAGDLQKTTQAINDAGRAGQPLSADAARGERRPTASRSASASTSSASPTRCCGACWPPSCASFPISVPFLAALFPSPSPSRSIRAGRCCCGSIALFLVAELISNNVVEPWLYGSSTGLSSLAIIMAAIFWTTLWGPVGLFLSTPLTVCLVVIGRYVPQLEFLGVLLGSDPVLAPEERLYQRLLAGNLEEAVEIAEDYVDEHSSREFYDDVAIPALRLAENDRQRSTTDTNYRRLVADTAICVVREVEDHVREKAASTDEPDGQPASPRSAGEARPPSVLCIAGRTELDRAAAEMMAEVLGRARHRSTRAASDRRQPGRLGAARSQRGEVVCLSYLHPQPQVYARYICRRLRRRAPHAEAGRLLLERTPQGTHTEDMARQMSADAAILSLDVCVNQVTAWAAHRQSTSDADGSQAPAVIDNEHERLTAMQNLGLAGARRRSFDEVAKQVAEAFGAPIALVSMITTDQQLMPGAQGLPPDLNASREVLREESVCGHVVATDEVIVSEDVTKDPRFTNNPLVLEKGIRFYAGAPLRTSAGLVLGSLCVIDMEPREFSDEERVRLQNMADDLMAELENGSVKDNGRRDPTHLSAQRQKQDASS